MKAKITPPIISISTIDNTVVDSKETWVQCTISTSHTKEKYTLSEASGKIKGRGNSTWAMPKKPYKFKFDSKTNLFGLGKAKTWVLLANYYDPSGLRNDLALSVGKSLADISASTTDEMFVEVFMNGEYLGLYTLCEQIEINSNRIDIDDDLSKLDTGYILEINERMGMAYTHSNENVDYILVNNIYYEFKEPTVEDGLSIDQVNFIKNYVTNADSALYSNNYSSVLEYFDVDTFAATYIVQEMFKSVDLGRLSTFIFKDAGGKLQSGPIWDFDITSGNCDYSETAVNPEYLYAAEVDAWYKQLLTYPEFKTLIGIKLNEYQTAIKATLEERINYALKHADAFYRNYNKWQTIGVCDWPTPQELANIKTWEGNVNYLYDWLSKSLNHIISTYIAE